MLFPFTTSRSGRILPHAHGTGQEGERTLLVALAQPCPLQEPIASSVKHGDTSLTAQALKIGPYEGLHENPNLFSLIHGLFQSRLMFNVTLIK